MGSFVKGAYFAWKATALGKNDVNAKTFLEKRFTDTLELDDGIHTALLTLRESFEVGMTEDNVEVSSVGTLNYELKHFETNVLRRVTCAEFPPKRRL